MFSGLIPLKKAYDRDYYELLLVGGIRPAQQKGKWEFSSTVFKIEGKEEFSTADLQGYDGEELGDFFFDNQWVQPDENLQEFYILGKNIYKISVTGDFTAVKQAPGYI